MEIQHIVLGKNMEEQVRVAVLEDCVGMIKRGMAIEDALDVIIKRYDEQLFIILRKSLIII
jgi:hypothetical protein